MSRGGARSGGGMMRGQPLPFDVDPDLEKDILGYDVESAINGGQEDPRQALFPVSGQWTHRGTSSIQRMPVP